MDENRFEVYLDTQTSAMLAQLSLYTGEPMPDLLTRIFEAGLAAEIQKN